MRRLTIALLILAAVYGCKNEVSSDAYRATTPASVATDCTDSNTPAVTTAASVTNTIGGPWERPMTMELGANDAALDCVCTSAKPNFRNNNTEESFANLARAAAGNFSIPPDTAVLVGHGTSGNLCTGAGTACADRDNNLIRTDTHNVWEVFAAKLKGTGLKRLRIIGCGVGAGTSGGDLLKYLANATGLTVLAPNSLVNCENGRVELAPGGSWREATPGSTVVTGAAVPSVTFTPSTYLKLRIGSEFKIFELKYVKFDSFTMLQTSSAKMPVQGKSVFSNRVQFDTEELLKNADLEHPQTLGEMLGLVTGQVDLIVAVNGVKTRRVFDIYSDQALRDRGAPDIFYRLSSHFMERVATQLR